MRINHNIAAIKANNQLRINNGGLSSSLEKLSSGYRINRAADDAAGMAISQKMKTQIRGLEQASRNAADGISVIQTAEGALAEVESMVQRMRELSVQAANGTNTLSERTAIQNEINELNEEVKRVSETTEFNTKILLNGTLDRSTYSSNSKVQVVGLSDNVDIRDYAISGIQEGTKASMTGLGVSTSFPITNTTSGKITINGESVEMKAGDTKEEVLSKLRDLCNIVGVNLSSKDGGDITAPGAELKFSTKAYGSDEKINITCDNSSLSSALGINTLLGKTVNGTDAKLTLGSGFTTTTTMTIKGNLATVTDNNGFEMKIKVGEGATGDTKITVLDAGPMNLQIGANEGQLMQVRIPEVSSYTLGLENLNVCTEETAQKAIDILDKAVQSVSATRATLGAYQNRLDHAISNLDGSAENLTEALARIEDVDMAEEMTEYTQAQVLTQANTAMLAQANQRPQTILSLLQG